jgi:hypothetical protein
MRLLEETPINRGKTDSFLVIIALMLYQEALFCVIAVF